MSHIRCKHCGAETEDDSKVSITHKSTCRSPGKDIDNEVLGGKPAKPRAIQGPGKKEQPAKEAAKESDKPEAKPEKDKDASKKGGKKSGK